MWVFETKIRRKVMVTVCASQSWCSSQMRTGHWKLGMNMAGVTVTRMGMILALAGEPDWSCGRIVAGQSDLESHSASRAQLWSQVHASDLYK